MKKTILVGTIISIAVLMAAPVFAQTPVVSTRSAARQDAVITRLTTRADNEITRRVTALTKLIARINDVNRLTSDQKTSLSSQIQDQINSLTTLKAKIDGDTDLATLRTDVQSIVTSYRIFALYIPKTYVIVHANRLLDIVDELVRIQSRLQIRVDSAKSAGSDTAAMQNLLSDMGTKLTDAKMQVTNAINAVTPLTPDGWPANKTTLVSARSMLVTARQDIQAAHKDEQTIRQDLVQLGIKVNAKITPVGATPTPTP